MEEIKELTRLGSIVLAYDKIAKMVKELEPFVNDPPINKAHLTTNVEKLKDGLEKAIKDAQELLSSNK